LRPRHHAEAAKEENDDDYEIRQSGYHTSVRKTEASDDEGADKAEPDRRIEEERLHDPPQPETA